MEPSIEMALILLLGGLFILVLELFIPSAGILLALALLCIVASVVVAFRVSPRDGVAFLVVVTVLAVVLPGIGLQIWKRSPIGRRMFLDAPGGDDEDSPRAPNEAHAADGRTELAELVGHVGRTLTPLRPSGMTDILGQRVDSVAEGVMIERGEPVRVVDVRGNRVVVRRLDPQETQETNPDWS